MRRVGVVGSLLSDVILFFWLCASSLAVLLYLFLPQRWLEACFGLEDSLGQWKIDG